MSAGQGTEAQTRHAYRGDIQAMRGLAVLVVVLFHAELGFPGGFVGVDVFFVISGFVITGALSRQLGRDGRLSFADFYARRARRLLPGLAAMTAVVMVMSIVVLPPNGVQQNAAKTGAAASVFSSNLYLYRYGVDYFDPPLLNPFLHTWSLGVEEQTYLILPLTLVVLWMVGRRLGRTRATAVAGIVGASVVSFGLSLALTRGVTGLHVPLPERFAFYSPVTRFWEFGLGVVLALVAHRLPRSSRGGVVIGLAGLGLVLVACFALTATTPFPGRAALLPVVGAAAMIAAGSISGTWQRRAAPAAFVWLGGLSYAWYLWHWPFIVFADVIWPGSRPAVLAAVVLSLGVAIVAQRVVEEPFRYDPRLIGRRAVALTGVCIVVGLAAAGVVYAGAQRGWGNADLRARLAEARRSRPERDGCDSVLRSAPCLYPGAGAATVALVGDSHAGAIADVLMESAHATGADFEVWTRPGCPFVIGVVRADPGGEACRRWADKTAAWLQANPPDVLVIHAASSGYASAGRLRDLEGTTAATDEAGAQLYADGLERIVTALTPLGTRVVVVGDVPTYPGSKVQEASLLHPDPAPVVRARRAVEAETAAIDTALAQLARDGGVLVVDPKPALCRPRRCSQYDGEWLYRDANHVTPSGAARLRSLFDGAVASATVAPGSP